MVDSPSEFLELEREAGSESTAAERLMELARRSKELARIVAQNSRATADILKELGYSQDALTRQAVVANPNAPTDILLNVGGEFPQQLLDNPVFGLLWLENPDLVAAMPQHTLSRLLECPRGQQELLETVANHSSRSIRYHAYRVLRNPNCAIACLERLAGSEDREVRSAIADNPQTPLPILERLANDPHDDVRRSISRNTNTPVSWLIKFANDRSDDVRANTARNPRTPASVLEQLSRDRVQSVRYVVARHPQTPIPVLETLAAEPDVNMRCAVTQNPNLPIGVLEKLAQCSETSIKRAVASHPKAPTALVRELLYEGAKWFRGDVARATQSVEILDRLARDWEPWVRQCVTENRYTPAILLEKLAKDEKMEIRINVAKHPNTPTAVLASLASDRYLKVRTEVAKNVNTEIEVLKGLARDRIAPVRQAAQIRLQSFL